MLRKWIAVLLLLGSYNAAIASTVEPQSFAESRLRALGVLESGDTGALTDSLTRAQVTTLIVRVLGQEENAQLAKGSEPFSDVPGSHWASGYIAVAKALAEQRSTTIGNNDGTFTPNGSAQRIMVLSYMMKLLGLAPDASYAYPSNWIEAAVSLGLLTRVEADSLAPIADGVTTRGEALFLIDAVAYRYRADGITNVYMTYLDAQAPVLAVEPTPERTTQQSLTLVGTTSADVFLMSVANLDAQRETNGTWSATIPLQVGVNSIVITVEDAAGNVASELVTLERLKPAGRIAGTNRVISPHGVERAP